MNPEPFSVFRVFRGFLPAATATFKRYVQFCLVGGSGVGVDMAVIFLLASPAMLGWNISLSKVIAAELALVNNFIWNDLWTFHGLATSQNHWGQRLARFAKFNLICTVGIGLSILLLNLQVFVLHQNLYLANLISIVLVSLWNFYLNLRFGWNSTAVEGSGRPEAVAAKAPEEWTSH